MKSHEELMELVAELLERFGVVDTSPMDPEEMTMEDYADRLAGIEGYSNDFGHMTYVLLPDDVQELFLELASAVYSDEDEGYETFGQDDDVEEELDQDEEI